MVAVVVVVGGGAVAVAIVVRQSKPNPGEDIYYLVAVGFAIITIFALAIVAVVAVAITVVIMVAALVAIGHWGLRYDISTQNRHDICVVFFRYFLYSKFPWY